MFYFYSVSIKNWDLRTIFFRDTLHVLMFHCHTKNTLDYSWRWQTEILGKLEASLEEAESRMAAVEERNNVLESVRSNLEAEVNQLERKKTDLLNKMSAERIEVAK